MRKFILCAPGLTDAQQEALSSGLKQPVGWWHHLAGTWLVVDPTDSLSTELIAGRIRDLDTKLECVVLEVTPKIWHTRLVPPKSALSRAWLEEFWEEKDA